MTVITEMCYHTNNNPDKQSLCITFSKVPSYSSFLFRYRKNHIIDCRFQKSKNNKNNKKTPKKKKKPKQEIKQERRQKAIEGENILLLSHCPN